MISLSAAAKGVLTSSYELSVQVESWRGGMLLASAVPVEEAGEEVDRTLRVPERVVLKVPRRQDGVNWSPDVEDHPLAANGQELHAKIGIGLGLGQVEWIGRGQYTVRSAVADGDQVSVEAAGKLTLIDEARLVSPFQPTGTIVSTLRALCEPALPVLVDATLTDRAVPTAVNWDEDRLGAVHELLDAWPATAAVDPGGFLSVTSATQSTTSVLSLTDGRGGTVIRAAGSSTRDGAYNAVVARGVDASTSAQIQGVAYLTDGPKAYPGPFNPLPVPKFFSSPLLTSIAQCQAAAATIAQRLQRETSREYRVLMVPHPGIQAGDVVDLTSAELGLAGKLCTVEALSLPWTPSDAGMPAMVLTVRTL